MATCIRFLESDKRSSRAGIVSRCLPMGCSSPSPAAVVLDFVEVGTAEEFKQTIADPELWHPKRGWKKVFESICYEMLPLQYDALKARITPGDTIIVAATLAFGARVLQDETGVPLATVHLQPSIIRSAYAPPKLPGAPPLGWRPPGLCGRCSRSSSDSFSIRRSASAQRISQDQGPAAGEEDHQRVVEFSIADDRVVP